MTDFLMTKKNAAIVKLSAQVADALSAKEDLEIRFDAKVKAEESSASRNASIEAELSELGSQLAILTQEREEITGRHIAAMTELKSKHSDRCSKLEADVRSRRRRRRRQNNDQILCLTFSFDCDVWVFVMPFKRSRRKGSRLDHWNAICKQLWNNLKR